jgi:hypothetical protein
MAGCCARATNGHAADEPATPAMKSRRFIASPKASDKAIVLSQTGIPEVV